ncbi:MAG TPA: outer membrane lipoprotein-sorting protein [Treponemataceae bacterium]|nr:outer membrane lipoprotein-sorting protein [Treponemataceae bacterium]
MKNLLSLIVLFFAFFSQIFAFEANEILAKVDERRAIGSSFTFTLKIDDYEKGVLSQTAVMSGCAKGANKTFVKYDEPANMRGKKLLMVNDDLFIFVPKTQRPVRLTPSQRLMGQASNGDVMNVRFQSDYTPTITGEETVKTKTGDVNCIILELSAKRPGSPYKKMILWVDGLTNFPVKADCYALSGKLLKTVEYSVVKKFNGKEIISKTILYDKILKDSYTVIEFLDMVESDVPDHFFNKEYLMRM